MVIDALQGSVLTHRCTHRFYKSIWSDEVPMQCMCYRLAGFNLIANIWTASIRHPSLLHGHLHTQMFHFFCVLLPPMNADYGNVILRFLVLHYFPLGDLHAVRDTFDWFNCRSGLRLDPGRLALRVVLKYTRTRLVTSNCLVCVLNFLRGAAGEAAQELC